MIPLPRQQELRRQHDLGLPIIGCDSAEESRFVADYAAEKDREQAERERVSDVNYLAGRAEDAEKNCSHGHARRLREIVERMRGEVHKVPALWRNGMPREDCRLMVHTGEDWWIVNYEFTKDPQHFVLDDGSRLPIGSFKHWRHVPVNP